jgi:Tfp pilus assembly protein PilO
MATPETLDEKLKAAQLRKLELELRNIKETPKWSSRIQQFIPVITALIAVSGFLWGIYTYNKQENARQQAEERQAIRDQELREKEYKKRFWEEQLDAYTKITQSSARLATLPAGDEREKEYQHFRELYHGNLIMFTDTQVIDAVQEFLQKYLTYRSEPAIQGEVDTLARKLAIACRESLRRTWDVPLEKIEFTRIP